MKIFKIRNRTLLSRLFQALALNQNMRFPEADIGIRKKFKEVFPPYSDTLAKKNVKKQHAPTVRLIATVGFANPNEVSRRLKKAEYDQEQIIAVRMDGLYYVISGFEELWISKALKLNKVAINVFDLDEAAIAWRREQMFLEEDSNPHRPNDLNFSHKSIELRASLRKKTRDVNKRRLY